MSEIANGAKRRWRVALFHFLFLFMRPMTLGVRVIVTNSKDEVLLVRHSYVDGWHLPGGGVEVKDTCQQTAIKEVLEETGIQLQGPISLFGIYANRQASKRDHVVVYECNQWIEAHPFKANREIIEIGFFALDSLPEGVTASTVTRLDEVFNNLEASQYW